MDNTTNGSTTTETSHMTMMTTTDMYKPDMNGSNFSTTTETSHMTRMTTTDMYKPDMNGSNFSTTTETSHMTMMTTTDMHKPDMNGSNFSTTTETSHMTMMTTTATDMHKPDMNGSNFSTTTETSHMTRMTTTDMYKPDMNGSNFSTTTETSHMTMMTTTDMYKPDMNGSNFSTTTETSHMTRMTTTDMYKPDMNGSNFSTTTETSHMTMMTTTDMFKPDMNGSNFSTTTETSHMTRMTTTDMYKPDMNRSNFSTTTETSHMTMMTTTDMYKPDMNGSNFSTTTETSHMTRMTTTDMYKPDMNGSNFSTTTETSHMTMMTTTDMFKPDMNGSNFSTTTETSHMTRMTTTDMYKPDMNRSNFSTTTETSHMTRMTTTDMYKPDMNRSNFSTTTETSHMTRMTTTDRYKPDMNGSNFSTTTETSHMTRMTTTDMYKPDMNGSNFSTTTETSHMTRMTTTDMYKPDMNRSNFSTTTETSHMTRMTTTDMYKPDMNRSNFSTTTETSHMTRMTTTDMYKPDMNGSNFSTTTETSHMTRMTTTDLYKPDMNGSNFSTTTETSHMTRMTTTDMYKPDMNRSNGTTTETTSTTMMMTGVARLEGCMSLSVSDPLLFAGSADAVEALERALSRAAGGGMMLKDAFVWASIVPGQTCDSGGMPSTTTSGYRRLQESVKVDYVILFPGYGGTEAAIQAAEDSKKAIEDISLNQMNQLASEEISKFPSLAILSVYVTSTPTVQLIVLSWPGMNGSNFSTTTETSHMTRMTTTDMYKPDMNRSNFSTTTETSHMTRMTTTDMYKPDMNRSNGTTTETTSTTMMMTGVARLEGCMSLSVSDPLLFAGSADAVEALERALSRAAGGGMMLKDAFVWASIVPGQTCDSGGMPSTTTSGYRRLQDSVKVDYVILFPGYGGTEAAIQAAEDSKKAIEDISLNQMNQLASEEISKFPSLAILSVYVTSTPTVQLIVMSRPGMNGSNFSTTTETSHMTRMTTTDMYKPDMNRSNFSTTTETSHMTRMTTTDMYKPDMNRSNGTTTETTSTTMMMTGVARLEGCMSLSVSDPLLFAGSADAVEALERALSRAAGGGMMLKDAFVWASIVPGQTCDSGGMPSTTTSGYRRLQDSVKVDYVILFPGYGGTEAAIQAAEDSKKAIEDISLNQMNQLASEEISKFPSLAILSVYVTSTPTVQLIVMSRPGMNGSNFSTTTETSHMTRMTTTDMYKPDMNRSNFSTTTETSHMTRMTTTDMYKPDMNRSNGTTTETTSTTMMMTGVARLEGCMSLSVSDPLLFAGSADAVEALERALSRAAGGGMMVKDAFVWASIVPGQTCDSGGMPSTTTSGYRRLQESVKVDYVILFPGYGGTEAAIQAAEDSKKAIEDISLNQMNQLASEEISKFPYLAILSVYVTSTPTVQLIVMSRPGMNGSNFSTTTETSHMTRMTTTDMYKPDMNRSNFSTTTETSHMTRMTTTDMYKPDMNRSNGTTTETTSTTMMITGVARLEGCMSLSVSDPLLFAGSADAVEALERALSRAAGGGMMLKDAFVWASIVPGQTCDSGGMPSTTTSGYRRLQESVKVDYVILFPGYGGTEAAIQAAEDSKKAIEDISLNQMDQLASEEISKFPSLAILSVYVTSTPTVQLIVMSRPGMNGSNFSTTTETSHMTRMTTTDMYKPDMNRSNGTTTETTSTTMMMTGVARLEGCMSLSVSDPLLFAGSADAVEALERALSRAAGGGMMLKDAFVWASIVPGQTCDSGGMPSTTTSGYRRLQESVKVDYVILFPGYGGTEAAIQAAEDSKKAIEDISLNQMNQLASEEISKFPSLAILSVYVTSTPTVQLIVMSRPGMNGSNFSTTTETSHMTRMTTTDMYKPDMNRSNFSTTTETSHMTRMTTTDMYKPDMNRSNGTTTETTSTTMMMTGVARLEGCMSLSVSDPLLFAGSADAVEALERALSRAAGGGMMLKDAFVWASIIPGQTCDSGGMPSTTTSGYRRLQDSVKVDYVILFPGYGGTEAAIQAAEDSKKAIEDISLNQMNQLASEEISKFPSLAILSVYVTSTPTVHHIVMSRPGMNGSNFSTTTETSHMTRMTTTDMYNPDMNRSNFSTTETSHMTRMTTTDMYKPDMNRSNGTTTETTSTTMMMTGVARLEGCMSLSVSDPLLFAGSADAVEALERALSRAAGGGMMLKDAFVWASIIPGQTCDSGGMPSTTTSGYRRLQDSVKVDYVILFPGHGGTEAAIQAAEDSKKAIEDISLNQMNQLASEEISRFPSLAILSVYVTSTPTVHLIVMSRPGMNGSNFSTTTETSHMTKMTTTDMYKPDMNRSNFSTTTETSHMTRMTTTDMYKPDMNRSNGTTTETTSTTMMMTGVARLEGCMSLSVSDPLLFAGSADAVEALERALSRAAGGGMMLKDAFVWVSIIPGQTCDSRGMSSTTTSGYRRLQDSVKVDYVILFPGYGGTEAAIQAAEDSKKAMEDISLNQMNQLASEEISRFPSLAILSVYVTSTPTVHLIVMSWPGMNGSNFSTTTETSHMTRMTTTDMYKPDMNRSNFSTTTETSHMTRMTTTGMYKPDMNRSNGTTTETTSTTMMMTGVARLEGCMSLSVSDPLLFAGSSDALEVLESALSRAAGGGMLLQNASVSASIILGQACDSLTTTSGYRRLQESVKVDYVILFPGYGGREAAIQAAENSKKAIEDISLNQMNQLVSEEISKFPSLAGISATVISTPSVVLITDMLTTTWTATNTTTTTVTTSTTSTTFTSTSVTNSSTSMTGTTTTTVSSTVITFTNTSTSMTDTTTTTMTTTFISATNTSTTTSITTTTSMTTTVSSTLTSTSTASSVTNTTTSVTGTSTITTTKTSSSTQTSTLTNTTTSMSKTTTTSMTTTKTSVTTSTTETSTATTTSSTNTTTSISATSTTTMTTSSSTTMTSTVTLTSVTNTTTSATATTTTSTSVTTSSSLTTSISTTSFTNTTTSTSATSTTTMTTSSTSATSSTSLTTSATTTSFTNTTTSTSMTSTTTMTTSSTSATSSTSLTTSVSTTSFTNTTTSTSVTSTTTMTTSSTSATSSTSLTTSISTTSFTNTTTSTSATSTTTMTTSSTSATSSTSLTTSISTTSFTNTTTSTSVTSTTTMTTSSTSATSSTSLTTSATTTSFTNTTTSITSTVTTFTTSSTSFTTSVTNTTTSTTATITTTMTTTVTSTSTSHTSTSTTSTMSSTTSLTGTTTSTNTSSTTSSSTTSVTTTTSSTLSSTSSTVTSTSSSVSTSSTISYTTTTSTTCGDLSLTDGIVDVNTW